MREDVTKEISRLNFEDFLWCVFIILSFLNILGDYDDKEYLRKHCNSYKMEANHIFTFTLIITLFIYLYFFVRNIKKYQAVSDNQKDLYFVKVFGSLLLIVGIICLLYFQENESSFIGSPSI